MSDHLAPDNLVSDQAPCDVCGTAPCSDPAFCSTCREADRLISDKSAVGNGSSWATPGPADSHLISRRAADITPKRIDFLWPGRLARGKHTAFAGEPGDGKSQLSVYVAATISRGSEWPCGEGRAPVGNVIIFNAEDGADDTIVPRLIAAGADLERIHIVSAVLQEDGKGRRTFNLQADLALLERKIREIGNVALVIIDPISSYMGKTDSHKNSEVRGALEPASEMAERMKVAILSITHFSKAGSGNTNKALHRFIGSIAFVGAPRAAFAVIEDADNEGRMLVLHAKNNMAPKPQGLAYRLLQTIVCDNIVASYVHWDGAPVTISADEALGATEDKRGRSSRETAETFLRERLAGGPVLQREVKADAEGAGLAWATVRRAKDRLGIKPEKSGMEGGWVWRLPTTVEGAQISRRCSTREVSTFGGNEHLREPNGYGVPAVEETPDAPDLSADLDIPDNLRRCDDCGQLGTAADPLHGWDWPDRPDGIRLHSRCEASWMEKEKNR
jgi:AAA domain-containing protein